MSISAIESHVPLLPYDLERTIIEFAAFSDHAMALKLLGLSHEVKRWIEPILYRHVKLESSPQADAFIHTIESSKTPEFFTNTIKSLSFTFGITFHQVARILSTCKNITSLSACVELSMRTLDITLDDINDFGQFVMNKSPVFTRLSLTIQPFITCPELSFHAPVLQNLTHLSIFGASEHFQRWTWAGFSMLNSLTHFAFRIDTSTSLQVIYSLIAKFPPLIKVVLVLISEKKGGTLVGDYLKDNREVQQLIEGDADKRITVGISEEDSATVETKRGLVVVRRWDDHFSDRSAWMEAEAIIGARARSSIVRIS